MNSSTVSRIPRQFYPCGVQFAKQNGRTNDLKMTWLPCVQQVYIKEPQRPARCIYGRTRTFQNNFVRLGFKFFFFLPLGDRKISGFFQSSRHEIKALRAFSLFIFAWCYVLIINNLACNKSQGRCQCNQGLRC